MNWGNLFKDNNDINEKTIVGFISFAAILIITAVDVIYSIRGVKFEIKEYMYDALVVICLGSLGINEVGRTVSSFSGRSGETPNTLPTVDESKKVDKPSDKIIEYE